MSDNPHYTLPSSPETEYGTLTQADRALFHIPLPEKMAQVELREIVEQYPQLWDGGKTVWGALIQAHKGLFETRYMIDLPGVVIYDPSGELDHEQLLGVRDVVLQLQQSSSNEHALSELTTLLNDDTVIFKGIKVRANIASQPLLVSVVMFCRNHLPDKKLSLNYFPMLINPLYPGVAMVLPYKWWPEELVDDWCGRNHIRTSSSTRICGHCHQPMRKVGLAAHYQHQTQVEIDICQACALIWFDSTESVRLSGSGIISLIQLIPPRSLIFPHTCKMLNF